MFSKSTLLLSLLPLAYATTCTVSGATSWPANNNFTGAPFQKGAFGGAQDIQDCIDFCKHQDPCFTQCSNLILSGQCNAVGGSACETGTAKLKAKRELKGRATLDCTSTETCYQYTDGSLLCVDLNDGLYHDDQNGKGSLVDGTYTSAAGGVITGTSTSGAAQSTGTSSRRVTTTAANSVSSSVSGVSSGSGSTGVAARTSTGTGTGTVGSVVSTTSGAAGAATSTAAAVAMVKKDGFVAGMGMVGVVLGLVL